MEIVGSLGGGTGKRAVTFSSRRLQPLKGSADLNISLPNSFKFYDSSWGYCWVLQAYLLSRTASVVLRVPWVLRFVRRVLRFGRLSSECSYLLLFVLTFCFWFCFVDPRFFVNFGIVSTLLSAFSFCCLDLCGLSICCRWICPEFVFCCPGFVSAFGFFSRICPGFWFFFPDFSRICPTICFFFPDYSRISPRLWEKSRGIERNWEKLRKIERNWEKLRVKSGALLGFCVFSLWMGKPSSPESPKRIHNKSPGFHDVAPCPPANPSNVLPWPREILWCGILSPRNPSRMLPWSRVNFGIFVPGKSPKNVALAQENVYDASSCPSKIPPKCCHGPRWIFWRGFLSPTFVSQKLSWQRVIFKQHFNNTLARQLINSLNNLRHFKGIIHFKHKKLQIPQASNTWTHWAPQKHNTSNKHQTHS